MSHILLLKEIYRLGYQCALILEDDCVFSDDALEQLATHRDAIKSAQWDLFYLGCQVMADYPDQQPPFIRVLLAFHGHAYAVRRDAIPAIIAAIGQRLGMMDGPFDEFRWPGLRKFRFHTQLAIQEGGHSQSPSYPKDLARGRPIHALTVCVDFGDRLEKALPQNIQHFDSYTVVTIARDIETQEISRRCGARVILTDALYSRGAKFDKGGAINDALRQLYAEHPDDWICHIDADVILPADLKIRLRAADPSPDCIYGMSRHGASAEEKWTNPISGFFQLWHASVKRLYQHHIDAGFTDTWFRDIWPTDKQVMLPMVAKHLSEPGRDWCGRVTPRLGENLVISREIGFGDTLLSAAFAAILRENDIPCLWWNHDAGMRSLIDLPQWDGKSPAQHYVFEYESFNPGDRNFLRRAIDLFAIRQNIRRPIKLTRTTPPLKIVDIPGIKGADVALCLTGGGWSHYRWYPKGDELKKALTDAGLTWIDAKSLWNHAAFNAIRKSRLYLGIDTGTTHAASALTKNGIVLQSGFNRAEDWNHDYGFEIMTAESACALAPCYLRDGCPHNHKCMEIPVSRIVARIVERLKFIPSAAPLQTPDPLSPPSLAPDISR